MLGIFFLTNISPERNINVAVIIFLQNLHEKKPQLLVLYRFYDFTFCNICP